MLAAIGKGAGRGQGNQGRQPNRWGRNGGKGGGRGGRGGNTGSKGAATSGAPAAKQTPSKPFENRGKVESRQCYNCLEYGHIGRDCPQPDKRKAKTAVASGGVAGAAKMLTQAGLPRLCYVKEKPNPKEKPRYEHKNKFDELRNYEDEDNNNNEREHLESTALVLDDKDFPTPGNGWTMVTKKRRMMKISKSSQQARKRELAEINKVVKYIMSPKVPLRKTESENEKKAPNAVPPPPTPNAESRRTAKERRTARRKTRTTSSRCNGDCDCEDPPHGLVDSSDDEEEVPKTTTAEQDSSDDEEDTPEFRSLLDEIKQTRENIDRAGVKFVTTRLGSSADLPLAADEPGSARYNHQDGAMPGTGETPTEAEMAGQSPDSQDLLRRPMELLRPCDIFRKAANIITRDGQ